MSTLDAWEQAAMETSSITTVELDTAAKVMQELREDYDEKKKKSSEAFAAYEEAKYLLLSMLTECGKTKYVVEGLGTVSKIFKKSTKVPKDVDSKRKMLQYFRDLGAEEYINFVSIHSATLNSYVNAQLEVNPDFILPGVGEQKITEELRFTKARSKK